MATNKSEEKLSGNIMAGLPIVGSRRSTGHICRAAVLCGWFILIAGASIANAGEFLTLEDIGQSDRPDFTVYGLKKMRAIPTSELWRPIQPRDRPDFIAVERAVLRHADSLGIVCLDIEHWPVGGNDLKEVQDSMSRLVSVASFVKDRFPKVRVGFYSTVPMRAYYGPADNNKSLMKNWQDKNQRLKPLAASVDVIFPSLYTFNHDQDAWVRYAEANIAEARKFGKPVIVFLWPQIHGSNSHHGYEFVSGDFWRLQLDTVYRLADGFVIWTPHGDKRTEFDAGSAWWLATRGFLATHANADRTND